jgi:hypothetical protein
MGIDKVLFMCLIDSFYNLKYTKFFQSRQQQLIPYWNSDSGAREERHCFQKNN